MPIAPLSLDYTIKRPAIPYVGGESLSQEGSCYIGVMKLEDVIEKVYVKMPIGDTSEASGGRACRRAGFPRV
jgi:hypothetical protein